MGPELLDYRSCSHNASLSVRRCCPQDDGDISGLGWHTPARRWQLPASLKTLQATGPPSTIWPQVPGRPGGGGIAQGGAGGRHLLQESPWHRDGGTCVCIVM